MFFYALICNLLISMQFFIIIEAARNFDVQWTSSNCSVLDAYYVRYFDCPITELTKKRGNYISANLILQRNIDKMVVEFRISLPGINNMDLLKFKTDGCYLFRYRAKNTILNAVIQKLIQSSNLPLKCPLKANFTYKINHYSLSPDQFPPYTPNSKFQIAVDLISEHKTLMFSAVAVAELKDKTSKH